MRHHFHYQERMIACFFFLLLFYTIYDNHAHINTSLLGTVIALIGAIVLYTLSKLGKLQNRFLSFLAFHWISICIVLTYSTFNSLFLAILFALFREQILIFYQSQDKNTRSYLLTALGLKGWIRPLNQALLYCIGVEVLAFFIVYPLFVAFAISIACIVIDDLVYYDKFLTIREDELQHERTNKPLF